MVPQEDIDLLPKAKKVFEFRRSKYNDTLCTSNVYTMPDYNPPRLNALMCYEQGGQGLLVDNYPKGNKRSGCEYLKLALDKAGISNDNILDDIQIFPNPANQNVVIEKNQLQTILLYIQSTDGKLLYSQKLTQQTNFIQLDTFPRGMYLFYFLTKEGQKIKVEKIILN
jgi:hypothetical protein